MIIQNYIKRVSSSVYRIGTKGVPIYLIDSERPVIIDAGHSFVASFYVDAIRSILGAKDPEFCLVTHSHFDHVGALGYFKKVFPGITIAASSLARDIASKSKSIEHISCLNEFASSLDSESLPCDYEAFLPFEIDMVLNDGDKIDLGSSLGIRVKETPGHTRDSLCFFLEPENIIFTGDSGGVRHDSGYIFFDFLSGCSSYLSSLERISSSGARIICPGHYEPLKDEDASDYLINLVPSCQGFIRRVFEVLEKNGGDLNSSMQSIKSVEYDVLDDPKQPEPAYMLNLEARVRSVMSFLVG